MFLKNSLILMVLLISVSCGEDCKFNSIKTEDLPAGKIGSIYEAQITYDITCSYTDKAFELVNGKLPVGIELLRSGKLSGTPTESGVYSFRVKVRICFASNGFEYSDCRELEKDLQIIVNE